MSPTPERRYRIGEASEKTGVAIHLLRQWEDKFPQLNPGRDRAGRRYYYKRDLELVRRIHYFLRSERMTVEGARLRLAKELHGEGRPQTKQEAIDLLDQIESEVRGMLDLLDSN